MWFDDAETAFDRDVGSANAIRLEKDLVRKKKKKTTRVGCCVYCCGSVVHHIFYEKSLFLYATNAKTARSVFLPKNLAHVNATRQTILCAIDDENKEYEPVESEYIVRALRRVCKTHRR